MQDLAGSRRRAAQRPRQPADKGLLRLGRPGAGKYGAGHGGGNGGQGRKSADSGMRCERHVAPARARLMPLFKACACPADVSRLRRRQRAGHCGAGSVAAAPAGAHGGFDNGPSPAVYACRVRGLAAFTVGVGRHLPAAHGCFESAPRRRLYARRRKAAGGAGRA